VYDYYYYYYDVDCPVLQNETEYVKVLVRNQQFLEGSATQKGKD